MRGLESDNAGDGNAILKAAGFRNLEAGVLDFFRQSAGALELFFISAEKFRDLRRRPVKTVCYRQIYFTGVEALSKIAAIALLIGLVIITQVSRFAGMDAALTGKVLVSVVKELGPLFVAVIVIARSCGAVASELGSMRVNREIDSLLVMGIDPAGYLILPRIVGITLSVLILAFYFQAFSIIGGLVASSLLDGIPFYQYLSGIYAELGFGDVGISLLKGLIFGLVISTVSCYHGFRVRGSATEIPKATTAAVMQSLLLVIAADAVVTLVL